MQTLSPTKELNPGLLCFEATVPPLQGDSVKEKQLEAIKYGCQMVKVKVLQPLNLQLLHPDEFSTRSDLPILYID